MWIAGVEQPLLLGLRENAQRRGLTQGWDPTHINKGTAMAHWMLKKALKQFTQRIYYKFAFGAPGEAVCGEVPSWWHSTIKSPMRNKLKDITHMKVLHWQYSALKLPEAGAWWKTVDLELRGNTLITVMLCVIGWIVSPTEVHCWVV